MALISKQIIRKIESELYDYPSSLKIITEHRNSILFDSHYPDVSVSGGETSNQTMSKGMRLAVIETGWTDLITEALATMPMQYSMLIRHKYFNHRNNDMTAEALFISRALYFAWKESAILCLALLAVQRGLVDTVEHRQIG